MYRIPLLKALNDKVATYTSILSRESKGCIYYIPHFFFSLLYLISSHCIPIPSHHTPIRLSPHPPNLRIYLRIYLPTYPPTYLPSMSASHSHTASGFARRHKSS